MWLLNSAAIAALQVEALAADGVEGNQQGRATGRLFRMDDWLRHALGETVEPDTRSFSRELAALVEEKTDASASFTAWRGDHAIPDDVDVVVQATSIGLYPDQTRVAVDATTLREGLVVADVIPNPPKTGLLKEAEAAGCRTIDGLGMLVNQGRVAIEYWTGVLPDAAVMRASLEALFG